MRKITHLTCAAFAAHKPLIMGNTAVTVGNEEEAYFALHGHLIATHRRHGLNGLEELTLGLAGWNTPTTRDRLNGILQALRLPYSVGCFQFVCYVWRYGERVSHFDAADTLTFSRPAGGCWTLEQ